jgi:plasmid maintenance system antidote protein VapI
LVHTVGQELQDILDKNDISQALLAYRTGLSPKHVNCVIKGKSPLSVEVALLIEEHFPQVKAFPLLMVQLRQDIAKVKMRRRQTT